MFSQNDSNQAIWLEYNGDKNGNHVPDAEEIGTHCLKSNGDFRNDESIDLLKQADIVVTNPPFSLFREYVAQLVNYRKKFLIIGNFNAISYKEIFKLIKENKLWLGIKPMGVDMLFDVSKSLAKKLVQTKKEGSGYRKIDGVIKARAPAIWFTNLSHQKRNEDIILDKRYRHAVYPKYDNYDAINVNKVVDIPYDYPGIMGVPITFLDKYNPAQFEILGLDDHRLVYPDWRGRGPDLNGKPIYRRVIIKNKKTGK